MYRGGLWGGVGGGGNSSCLQIKMDVSVYTDSAIVQAVLGEFLI